MKEQKTSGKPNVPEWMGRLPFEPDRKRPNLFKREDGMTRLYGKGGNKVYTRTFLSTDKLSASSFKVAPGGTYFEPFDIHAGDEVYYIISGKGVIFNPYTGLAYPMQAGDMVWIPKGVWHQAYNFEDEELSVSTAFAPKMWGDEGIPTRLDGDPLFYKTEATDWLEIPRHSSRQDFCMKLGSFPADGPAARQSQEIFVLPPERRLSVIHGEANRMLVSFAVSNDFIHAGVITIPGRFESDVESHGGDELIYVAEGSVSVVVQDESYSPEAVSVKRYEVNEGERFFVPESVRHSYVNLSGTKAKFVFFTAPEL
ncbi:MAG: cupin domain-containing protein [Armatimonadetes bacterium]|nr:cupin domain-containing protein [Armatimonadota bacterium]